MCGQCEVTLNKAIIYRAAGCVIFEILCGYHPFRGSTDLETVFNVLEYRLNIPEVAKVS